MPGSTPSRNAGLHGLGEVPPTEPASFLSFSLSPCGVAVINAQSIAVREDYKLLRGFRKARGAAAETPQAALTHMGNMPLARGFTRIYLASVAPTEPRFSEGVAILPMPNRPCGRRTTEVRHG